MAVSGLQLTGIVNLDDCFRESSSVGRSAVLPLRTVNSQTGSPGSRHSFALTQEIPPAISAATSRNRFVAADSLQAW